MRASVTQSAHIPLDSVGVHVCQSKHCPYQEKHQKSADGDILQQHMFSHVCTIKVEENFFLMITPFRIV